MEQQRTWTVQVNGKNLIKYCKKVTLSEKLGIFWNIIITKNKILPIEEEEERKRYDYGSKEV